ncbi:MAG: hypothetical protein ACR2JM_06600, partial [Mycobacterium sp.]
MSDTPFWVIPAITAASSLMGTVVGGVVGYWNSTRMHERTTAAEEARIRNTLLHESAIAFITGIAKLDKGHLVLERITQQWGPATAIVLSPDTDDEDALKVARRIYPSIEAGGGRLRMLLSLARETGVLDY